MDTRRYAPEHADVFLPPAAHQFPEPYPGRVIEVYHPGAVAVGGVQHRAVTAMVGRGMRELAGVSRTDDAWRVWFAPGDVVGIKVNAVGRPAAISSFALVDAVVSGLIQAGVTARDIIVFDRYQRHLHEAGYLTHLPDGVHWDAPSVDWDPVQTALDGYDPAVYWEPALPSGDACMPQPCEVRRSHLCLIVSRYVNKVINLPVLKDHGVAGVSLALKNMSHGLVNNVARSHASPASSTCRTFIPDICAMPEIRRKVVLHILDGTRAVFDGGPLAPASTTWAHRTLYFATDPVALDRIGWAAVDAKRRAVGLPPVAEAKAHLFGEPPPTDRPTALRQPQHITRAGDLDLGVADLARIDHRRIAVRE